MSPEIAAAARNKAPSDDSGGAHRPMFSNLNAIASYRWRCVCVFECHVHTVSPSQSMNQSAYIYIYIANGGAQQGYTHRAPSCYMLWVYKVNVGELLVWCGVCAACTARCRMSKIVSENAKLCATLLSVWRCKWIVVVVVVVVPYAIVRNTEHSFSYMFRSAVARQILFLFLCIIYCQLKSTVFTAYWFFVCAKQQTFKAISFNQCSVYTALTLYGKCQTVLQLFL